MDSHAAEFRHIQHLGHLAAEATRHRNHYLVAASRDGRLSIHLGAAFLHLAVGVLQGLAKIPAIDEHLAEGARRQFVVADDLDQHYFPGPARKSTQA